ncbi:class IV adenylate cyclase [Embleya sp. NPDC020886]|uniref:class IV adenylate cyclase n=1 Tax=Embleya sp. NPDC020886 TaxID=3363980 RepID=UPI0037B801DC
MIEAELKARVLDPESVLDGLEKLASGRAEVYQDTYYDDAERTLTATDQELRIRTVHGAETVSLMTYKGARVDEASGSKPEHETCVEDVAAAHALLRGLGYTPTIEFEKRCRNYDLERGGRQVLATLVRVPELDETFIEIETLVKGSEDVADALDVVREVLGTLGIGDDAYTTELYTDAVAARRSAAQSGDR